MDSFEEIEPNDNSLLPYISYAKYIPYVIKIEMEEYRPMAYYYKIDPFAISQFFSYVLNKKRVDGEIFGLFEVKAEINDNVSPYKNVYPLHLYSAKLQATREDIAYISILRHEKFNGSVIIISMNDMYKIASFKDDVDEIIKIARQSHLGIR